LAELGVRRGHVVTGQRVEDPGPVTSGAHQVGLLEDLQVRGRGGQPKVGGLGELIDGPLALRQQVQQLQSRRASSTHS